MVFKGLLCVSVVVFSLSLVLITTQDTMEYYVYNQNNITVGDILGCTHVLRILYKNKIFRLTAIILYEWEQRTSAQSEELSQKSPVLKWARGKMYCSEAALS